MHHQNNTMNNALLIIEYKCWLSAPDIYLIKAIKLYTKLMHTHFSLTIMIYDACLIHKNGVSHA